MNDKTNSFDYKSISLMLTGEISSACINRNNLIQPTKQTTISFMDNMEDDDEQFILNLKKNIDNSSMMQNQKNYSIRNLQNKSYSLKKKKKNSAFSDEDQNLIKRFKNSVDENKSLCITPQNLQMSKNINYFNNLKSVLPTSAPLFTPAVLNNIDINLRHKANQFLLHVTSNMQKNNQITPTNIKTVAKTEIEELIYYEMKYLTPPEEIN